MAPIQSYEIPVEIFIIFLENDQYYFSVRNIVDTIDDKFKETVQPERVRQICEGLTQRKRLVKEKMKVEGTNVPTNHYRINHVPDVPSDNIIASNQITVSILREMKPIEMLTNGEVKKEVKKEDDK